MEDFGGVKDAICELVQKVNAIEASVVALNDRIQPNADCRHAADSRQPEPAIAAEAEVAVPGEHQGPVSFDSPADLQAQIPRHQGRFVQSETAARPGRWRLAVWNR